MLFKQPKPKAVDRGAAEAIAAEAVSFLAADPSRLTRFLGDSGMDPEALAAGLAQGDEGVLMAALDHVVCDESLLLVLASELRRKPEEIMTAHALLQGPAPLSST